MSQCATCGSFAFNLGRVGINQGDLCDAHYWQARALRAEAAVKVAVESTPSGMVLVPIIPTEKMVDAGFAAMSKPATSRTRATWKAMLGAAAKSTTRKKPS
jgi:hypothetical protein